VSVEPLLPRHLAVFVNFLEAGVSLSEHTVDKAQAYKLVNILVVVEIASDDRHQVPEAVQR